MTELKTLKDLKTRIESKQLGFILLEKELKQEAIKWVKAQYRKNEETGEYEYFGKSVGLMCEFFNLTEEDLNG